MTPTREAGRRRHVAILAEAARVVAESHRRKAEVTPIGGRLGAYGRFGRKRYYLRSRGVDQRTLLRSGPARQEVAPLELHLLHAGPLDVPVPSGVLDDDPVSVSLAPSGPGRRLYRRIP